MATVNIQLACIHEGEKGKNLFGALKLKPLLMHIFFVVLT